MKSSIDLIIATVQILLFLGAPAALLYGVIVMRHRERQKILEVAREAAAAGHPLTPEALQVLAGATPRPPWRRDLRRGVMLMAIGVGLALIGLLAGIGVASTGMSGAVVTGVAIAALGAMPACIGAALIVLSRTERD